MAKPEAEEDSIVTTFAHVDGHPMLSPILKRRAKSWKHQSSDREGTSENVFEQYRVGVTWKMSKIRNNQKCKQKQDPMIKIEMCIIGDRDRIIITSTNTIW